MTSSTFSARALRAPGVARRRWWALGAIVGVLLAAAAPVAATSDTPAEVLVAATPDEPAGSAAAVTPDGPIDLPAAVTPGAPVTSSVAVPVAASKGVQAPVAARTGPPPMADDRTPALDADAGLATLATGPSILPRSEPTRVRVPAIGVDSELVGLGLQDDGSMEVPPGAFPAGWYTGAPTPGELGPAILAGHVDYGGTAGVFHRLRELEPGDVVEVTRQDGSTAVFRVTRVEHHRKDAFPTAAVYGDIDHAGLRLITCGGPFDHGVHSYVDNVVVFADLDPAGAGARGHRS